VLAHSFLFTGCYLLLWTCFSIFAALAQTALVETGLVSQIALSLGNDMIASLLLLGVALYQLTWVKRACLSQCRSPLSFLMRLWRPGAGGAVRLGLAHGVYCLGCCWLLMLLLFVGGVMNLLWVALLAIIVTIEKLAPPGIHLERWVAAAAGFGAVYLLIS
jgi:predicted metal-binding membrane protein